MAASALRLVSSIKPLFGVSTAFSLWSSSNFLQSERQGPVAVNRLAIT